MLFSNANRSGPCGGRRVRGGLAAIAAAGVVFLSPGDMLAQDLLQDSNPDQMTHPGLMPMPQAQTPELPDQWENDMDGALAKAGETDKPVLAMFSAAWSTPCQMMIREVLPDPRIVSELEDWVPVYVDGGAEPELVAEYEVENYPTYVILDANGDEQGRFEGGAANAGGFLVRLDAAVDYEEKLAAAEIAAAESPDSPQALHRLGDLKMAGAENHEDFVEAIRVYKKALKANPTDTGNIEPGLAVLLNESLKTDEAVAEVSQQIEHSPEDPALYKKRADLRIEDPLTLDPADAMADYRKAASLDPEDETGAAGSLAFHEIRDSFAKGEADATQLAARLEQFETRHPRSDKVPESMLLRSYVKLQGGDFETAAGILSELVDDHPTDETAETARQLLADMAAHMQQQQMMQQQQQQQQPQPETLPLQ